MRDCPENYISNVAERINIYTALSAMNDEENLDAFTLELVDRFGVMPKAVRNLILSIRLKIAAQNIFAEKAKTNHSTVYLYFNNNLGEEFYQAPTFATILSRVNTEPSRYEFKQGKNHLIVAMKGFESIYQVIEQIKTLNPSV